MPPDPSTATSPVLYSFRRCPYAIRARLAIAAAGVGVELREVVLRDKPQEFLEASPSASVPCLVLPRKEDAGEHPGAMPHPQQDMAVIDESLDIMIWALERNDSHAWLEMPRTGYGWIERCDGPFKHALDRTKYAPRYPGADPEAERRRAGDFLSDLNAELGEWIFDRPTLADFAILPFVRQFAFIDKARFDAGPWPKLQAWLERFLASDQFDRVMRKYPQWRGGDAPLRFP